MESVGRFFRNVYRRVTGKIGDDDIPTYVFYDTIEDFGYHFNEEGKLVDKDGSPFNYNISEDGEYNQQRYDALGELVTDYVYKKMEIDLQLHRVFIPVGAAIKDEPRGFIFQTRDAEKRQTLMVIIGGTGVVRAGQWSRKLIINEGLEVGSQFPYIRRAEEAGYGVMVLNTNQNQQVVNGRARNIRGSATAEEHGLYVWEHIIHKTAAANIVVVAHSLGGTVCCAVADRFLQDFQKRVFCVVFTDSIHIANRPRWSQPLKNFLKERAVNFATTVVPSDCIMQTSSAEDCLSVSAGTKEHERTSHMCIDSAFRLILDNHATWTVNRTMAPRHFKPLPEDLTPYSLASRWESLKKGKGASSGAADKPALEMKKRSTSDTQEEESLSKNGRNREDKPEVRPTSGGKDLQSAAISTGDTEDDTHIELNKEQKEVGAKQVTDSKNTKTGDEMESKTERTESETEEKEKKTEDRGSANQKDMDKDVVGEEMVIRKTGVTKDTEEAVVGDTEDVVNKDTEEAVSSDTKKAVTWDTKEAVTRDTETVVTGNTEKTVPKDTEEAVTGSTKEVFTRGTEIAATKDTEAVVIRDTEEAVTRDTEEAVTRDTEEAVTRDTEETVIRDTEKGVTEDTRAAVSGDTVEQHLSDMSFERPKEDVSDEMHT